jgi:polyhydroxybutyrate depolymerase
MRRIAAIGLALALSGAVLAGVGLAADFPAKGDPAKAVHRTLMFRGLKRGYLVQPVAGSGSFPVVIALHGASVSAERQWAQTSLATLGAREHFIVVAPQGVDNRWDEDSGAGPLNDVEFLRAVMRDVEAKDHGDPKAVFMIGMSNGGFMTIHFVCAGGGAELRAAGVVSATLDADQLRSCAPKKPLPWIEMHGDADDIVPFQEGEGLIGAEKTFAFFADRAGCAKAIAREPLPDLTPGDGSTAEKRVRSGCAGGTSSTFYVFHGAGHSWPNSRSGPPGPRGAVNQDVDGGTIAWAHFKATLALK